MKPKFSLRDLLWLVAVAALCCGWWVERQKAASEAAELQAKLARIEEFTRVQNLYAIHDQLIAMNLVQGKPFFTDWQFDANGCRVNRRYATTVAEEMAQEIELHSGARAYGGHRDRD